MVQQGAGGRFVRGPVTLSEKEGEFVRAYIANGGIATKAAEAAGYGVPASEGWRLLQRSHIRRAIDAGALDGEQQLRLLSLAALRRVLQDTGQPGTVTVAAAREAREAADRLRAIREDMERRNGDDVPVRIADGAASVPDGAPANESGGILDQILATLGTNATQSTDNAT
jgi:hypothetical protein